jgi:hypothetical protein
LQGAAERPQGGEPSRIGEPAGHDSDAWRREIMRLNKLITGNEISTGRQARHRRPTARSPR